MTAYTLGINAAFHDSAACLVRDGEVVAAAEEERFNRIKHGKRPVPFTAWELPFAAIDYCLGAADIRLADVAHVAYSFNPGLMAGYRPGAEVALPLDPSRAWHGGDGAQGPWASPWEPLFHAYVFNAPRQLAGGAPHHLKRRFAGAAAGDTFQWHFVEHHLAHEASACLAAPLGRHGDRAAVMTLDGRGERATTTLATWRDGRLNRLRQTDFPHSLGLLYEDLTRYLGFLHSSDEYKVMALASYGRPVYRGFFREVLSLDDDGGFRVRPDALSWLTRRFGPARERGGRIEQRHFDIAASLQAALEEATLRMARWLREHCDERVLCMAGGVALNCVMNARLRDSRLFDEVWVQPAAGDAGTALGAALWIDRQTRGGSGGWQMDHAYLGPAFSDDEIEATLTWAKLPYCRLDDVAGETAALLAANRVVGWFQQRMEFGPRALGARSILASPLDAAMQARLNELKDREDFRPVAPAVLEEAAGEWFVTADGRPAGPSPFMLFVFGVRPERAARIPAAVHVDGTARIQTVTASGNPRFHALLSAFAARTGVPVLINTSFNVRGEPIVCTPRDAIASFYATPLDALVLGSFLLEKRA